MIDLQEIGYIPKGLPRKLSRATKPKPKPFEEKDPLLALRGLGKELWKDLGGGEKFIRELRSNSYVKRQDPALIRQKLRPAKRRRVEPCDIG